MSDLTVVAAAVVFTGVLAFAYAAWMHGEEHRPADERSIGARIVIAAWAALAAPARWLIGRVGR
ncbi:hypothetical protein [Allonocardiopsis opalescens]|uniref:Uncharacterized protein n=1 Tax=Allonocardiopsis opalescens TaxID=1144618 RepID=A0A2T0PPN3_9ACTN|nr:hypothetical protein [Allonocardiopsis opalescens]PRX90837.1 hypothetical protein CLV72_11633 [Allonocardiopsis opalescens]